MKCKICGYTLAAHEMGSADPLLALERHALGNDWSGGDEPCRRFKFKSVDTVTLFRAVQGLVDEAKKGKVSA